jgi:hypothetical protein
MTAHGHYGQQHLTGGGAGTTSAYGASSHPHMYQQQQYYSDPHSREEG